MIFKLSQGRSRVATAEEKKKKSSVDYSTEISKNRKVLNFHRVMIIAAAFMWVVETYVASAIKAKLSRCSFNVFYSCSDRERSNFAVWGCWFKLVKKRKLRKLLQGISMNRNFFKPMLKTWDENFAMPLISTTIKTWDEILLKALFKIQYFTHSCWVQKIFFYFWFSSPGFHSILWRH